MLDNERLIVKMSLEQKVKLVTSLTMYESSPVDNYEFPVFRLKAQPYEGRADICATQFPCDRALASTWNAPLIGEVYGAIGEETRAVHSYGYFNNTNDYTAEKVSNDNFLTAKFVLARILGLERSGQAANLEELPIADGEYGYDKKFITDTVMAEAKPASVLVRSAEDVEEFAKKYRYGNLFYGVAKSAEETERLLLAGCSLVFMESDFMPELLNFFTARTQGYREAYKSYRDGNIKLAEFDRRVRNLEIFDEGIIDKACDNLLNLLLKMKEGGENLPEMNGLDEGRKAKFDEIGHDALALKAARQSVVLLKNDGILPLSRHTNVAVAGGYANDISYQRELFNSTPTATLLPFDVINEYDGLTPKGFSAGYAKGEVGRTDLIESALGLCGGADCVLLYLSAGRDEKLPPEQLELVDALYNKGLGIIAVVACADNIDFSFADKCKAVLLTYAGGQEVTAAVLDIVSGLVSPSGKLTEEIVRRNGEVMYPFGHGLSYTTFEYRNFRVNANGVAFTVENTGSMDGYAGVQLYVQREGATNFFVNRTLRGFAKAYIKKGDSVNLEIPFDENTFKAYSDEKKCYVIEGGDYKISVAEDYDGDKLSGTLTLAGYVYKTTYENEVVESTGIGEVIFTDDKQRNEILKARKKLSFGVKLFLALMLGVYYNAVICVFAFTPVIPDKGTVLYAILGALAFVFDALLIVYIILISKQRKKQAYLTENEVLTDMVDKIDEFKEVAKVTYQIPVKEEDEKNGGEEEEEVKSPWHKEEEPEKERKFDASFEESGEEVSFAEQVSLPELGLNFRDFVRSYGVNIEINSARALIASAAASKIVVLRSANAQAMPIFTEALCAYFGAPPATEAGDCWKNAGDLLWREEDDKFVLSDFANAVYAAGKSPEKRSAALLSGVSAENVLNYLSDFVNYANHFTEEHVLELSEDLSVKLPDNITYFVIQKEGENKNFPREFINAATFVELALGVVEKGEAVEVKNVSQSSFGELVRTARDEAYLSEKMWKRTDELISAVNATEKFVLGNKNTLQTEKLTSVVMECGGDETEALTQMFVCKLIPLLKTTRLYAQNDGDRTITGMIEKLYPEEDLSRIKKALAKL